VEDDIDKALEEALDAEMEEDLEADEDDEDQQEGAQADEEDGDDQAQAVIANSTEHLEHINKTLCGKRKILAADPQEHSAPKNFSCIKMDMPTDEIRAKFPHLEQLKSTRMMTCTLRAGQMLYLPCGWFHEVLSEGEAQPRHMALNYWFHPPDTTEFDKPYAHDFWAQDWVVREAAGLR
jgi:hypothetical protein